jgi:toxin ParE1/3/4
VSISLVLRAEAEKEVDEAFGYYDAQRPGLGPEFLAEVQRVFDRIAVTPLLYAAVLADVRKAVVRRFPYCVYYRAHQDRVEVLAVFHTSRDSTEWRRRA